MNLIQQNRDCSTSQSVGKRLLRRALQAIVCLPSKPGLPRSPLATFLHEPAMNYVGRLTTSVAMDLNRLKITTAKDYLFTRRGTPMAKNDSAHFLFGQRPAVGGNKQHIDHFHGPRS